MVCFGAGRVHVVGNDADEIKVRRTR
jgi:hypothetical protein